MELRNFFKKKQIKNLAQNSCEFNPKNPRKKFLKIFAAASLALITCATTLLATAPFGSGAANAATNTNLPNNAQTASPLGLDPENDPVVYTTSSGLEIKYAYAKMPSGAFQGCPYFTMGTYSEQKINWLVVGINHATNSPAGNAINNDLNSALTKYFGNDFVKHSTEITPGCILAVSEKVLFTANYSSAHWGNCINGPLHTNLKNWVDTDPELSAAYANGIIVDQEYKLQVAWLNRDDMSQIVSCTTNIFIFGGVSHGGATFVMSNYLTEANQRIAYNLNGSLSYYASSTCYAGGAFWWNFNSSNGALANSGDNQGCNDPANARPIIVCNLY